MNIDIFLGANGAEGFFSYYETRLADIRRVYILKGTPGSGKSTLIKKVGAAAEALGMRAEYWHCSADSGSLDGVYIRAVDAAVVDGTSPHVIDASLPLTKEFIVNLGDCLDDGKLSPFSQKLKKLAIAKKQCFSRAYLHLKCALCDTKLLESYYLPYIDLEKIEELARERKAGLIWRGKTTKQFMRSLTPEGRVCFDNSLVEKELVTLHAANPLLIKLFLAALTAGEKGYDGYYCPLEPKELDAVAVGNVAFSKKRAAGEVINLNRALCEIPEIAAENEIKNRIAAAENRAVSEMAAAKAFHAEMETYFIAAADFKKLDSVTNELIAKFFS